MSGNAILKKQQERPSAVEYGDSVGELIARLIGENFHGKVEISIHKGEVTHVRLDSKLPYDRLYVSNIISFKI